MKIVSLVLMFLRKPECGIYVKGKIPIENECITKTTSMGFVTRNKNVDSIHNFVEGIDELRERERKG